MDVGVPLLPLTQYLLGISNILALPTLLSVYSSCPSSVCPSVDLSISLLIHPPARSLAAPREKFETAYETADGFFSPLFKLFLSRLVPPHRYHRQLRQRHDTTVGIVSERDVIVEREDQNRRNVSSSSSKRLRHENNFGVAGNSFDTNEIICLPSPVISKPPARLY